MDELTRALTDILNPLHGGEKTNPFTQIRVGQVVKVYSKASDVPANKDADSYVGSVQVRWLDRLGPVEGLNRDKNGSQQIIPWSYPVFSNPLLDQPITTTSAGGVVQNSSVGTSYGIYYVPAKGDLAVCGFRGPSLPVVLGFIPQNLNKQQLATNKPSAFGFVPTLVQGELMLQSQQQTQVYLDRAGTVQLIVKSQPSGSGNPPIDKTTVPTTELARVSLGVSYSDPDFSQPVLSPYNKQVICNIKLANGSHIQIDSVGNVDIQASGEMHMGSPSTMSVGSGASLLTGALNTLMATVNGMTVGASTFDLKTTGASTWEAQSVSVNSGAQGAARKLDQTLSNAATDSAFWTFIQTLVTTFNAHTHLYSPGPGGPTPTAPPLPPIITQPTQQVGQINTASPSVKIGD